MYEYRMVWSMEPTDSDEVTPPMPDGAGWELFDVALDPSSDASLSRVCCLWRRETSAAKEVGLQSLSLAEARSEAERMKDAWLRVQAEFDAYRKRGVPRAEELAEAIFELAARNIEPCGCSECHHDARPHYGDLPESLKGEIAALIRGELP